jgi:hypothetical protein
MIRLRIGKFCGARKGAHGEFADECATLPDLLVDLLILLGINHVDSTAQDGHGRSGHRAQGPSMRAGVNPAGQAADDHQSPGSEISSQPFSHLIPVGAVTSRPDDRNRVPGKKFYISVNIQEGRGIVDLPQAGGILRLVPREQAATGGLCLCQFPGRVAQRALRMNRLSHGRGQALRFQRRQRRVEDGIRAAELPQ